MKTSVKGFFSRMLHPFRGSFPIAKAGSKTWAGLERLSEVSLIASVGVSYTILEQNKPALISGFLDLSNLAHGDSVRLSTEIKVDMKEDFKELRTLTLSSPTEPWLAFEERFYPALRIRFEQVAGIGGKKFRAVWYSR